MICERERERKESERGTRPRQCRWPSADRGEAPLENENNNRCYFILDFDDLSAVGDCYNYHWESKCSIDHLPVC